MPCSSHNRLAPVAIARHRADKGRWLGLDQSSSLNGVVSRALDKNQSYRYLIDAGRSA